VTKTIQVCYGHRLLNYAGKCRHLHGHNGKVEIELSSERLDRRGMVRDFEEIKRTLQRWIDTTLDHTMLLRKDDPLAATLRAHHERYVLLETNPTAEAIAQLIFLYATRHGFPVTTVRLWETDQSFATFSNVGGQSRRPQTQGQARRVSSRAQAPEGWQRGSE
jgi:6-pyruvoyltetrahydropterin/6-carboxytetrahydropterin synthase